MNRNAAFNRKVAYSICIVLLLLAIARIGQPESPDSKGGVLAEMRRENGLSQAELGAIDPAGETMKLATLGMRGVAANMLWQQATYYKKTENWDSLSATLNQITKLQPNFVAVWDYQAHNLAYNISAQFDDYRHRYHWVKKGITFLMSGTKYNRKEPRLLVYTGRYFGQKIGRSDETKQFRRLFRKDKDFHRSFAEYVNVDDAIGQNTNLSNEPDNWLVGRLFFIKAEKLVETEGVPIRGDSPLLFYSNTPKARMNYCMANEKDGNHGERAVQNWRQALAEWLEFGSRDIPTSFGHNLRLNDEEVVIERVRQLNEEFEQLSGDLREKIREERRELLSKAEAEALAKHSVERTPLDHAAAMHGQQKLFVSLEDVVERLPAADRKQGEFLATKIADLEKLQQRINSYRSTVNFNYWKMRCEVESLENTDLARQLEYDANQLLQRESDLVQAKKKFDQAFQHWELVFKEFPNLMTDDMAEDLMKSVNAYQTLLDQLGEEFPQDFPLKRLIDVQQRFTPGVSPPLDLLDRTEEEAANEKATSDEAEGEPQSQPETPKDAAEQAENPSTDADDENKASEQTAKPADAPKEKEDAKPSDPAAEKPAGEEKPAEPGAGN